MIAIIAVAIIKSLLICSHKISIVFLINNIKRKFIINLIMLARLRKLKVHKLFSSICTRGKKKGIPWRSSG